MLQRFAVLLGLSILLGCGPKPTIVSQGTGKSRLDPTTHDARASDAGTTEDRLPSDREADSVTQQNRATPQDRDAQQDNPPSELILDNQPNENLDGNRSTAETETDLDDTKVVPDGVQVISFDDLNIGMPVDAKFRNVMLTFNDGRVKELQDTRVNVAGYMNATDSLKGVKEFILLRNLECKFGPGGQADHLVHVILQGDLETEFTDKVVYVEGILRINPFPEEGPSTWSIYDLEATKVSTSPPPRSRS